MRQMRLGAALCAVLAVMLVSATALADEPEAPERTDWNENEHCLRHGAKTKHGNANYGTAPDVKYTGEHVGFAHSLKHFHFPLIGTTIECAAHRPMGPGTIAVNVHVFKLNLVTGQPALCKATGFVTNTPADVWSYSVHVVPVAGYPALCGEGHYKTQAFARVWDNGKWNPMELPCTKQRVNNCLQPAIVPAWHFFPASLCHVQPSATTCGSSK